jgi:hypothetical protein
MSDRARVVVHHGFKKLMRESVVDYGIASGSHCGETQRGQVHDF